MSTVEDYRILAGEVYHVDILESGQPWLEGDIIENVNLTQSYVVLEVEDNTTNGMQAMAVAPVENGKADTSKIVIAYAGTNASDSLDIKTDAQTVVGGNKELDVSGLWGPPEFVDGQIITAEVFAKNVTDQYPDAEISTTGHSLGEYIALYIAAENGWKNVGFNGPDPYHILSQEARDWVEANPGMLYNYRNDRDLIGNFRGNGTGAEIRVDMDMGLTEILDAHALSAWRFDEDGNLIIEDTKENQGALQILAQKQMYERMQELREIAANLREIGGRRGGLSATDKIFLDNAQALITVEYASQSMNIALERLINIYQNAISRAEENWEIGLQKAQAIGEDLSHSEILTALAIGGATKDAIVDTPVAFYKEKIAKAQEIGDEFDRLATDIKASLDLLLQSDADIASQIKQGA